jgi:hypothetical protein
MAELDTDVERRLRVVCARLENISRTLELIVRYSGGRYNVEDDGVSSASPMLEQLNSSSAFVEGQAAYLLRHIRGNYSGF